MTYSERLAKQASSKLLQISESEPSHSSNSEPITKADFKSISKSLNRKPKKKVEPKLTKEQKDVLRKVSKGLNLIEEKKAFIDRVRDGGIEVEEPDFRKIEKKLNKIKKKAEKGKRLSEDDLAYVKDFSKKNVYDSMIRYTYNVNTTDEDGRTSYDEIRLSDAQLKRLRAKQAKNPRSLSDIEVGALSKITKYQMNVAPDTSDEEVKVSSNTTLKVFSNEDDKQKFIDSFKVTRDTAIGGNSQLINDLWYSMDADGWYGKYWCEYIQRAMQIPEIWLALESAYRKNEDHMQTKLQTAMDNAWYDNFTDFKNSVVAIIDKLKELGYDISEIEETMDEEWL